MSAGGQGKAVVVGIDGSAEALSAAQWAVFEARRRGVPLRLISALDQSEALIVDWPALGRAAYGERLRVVAEEGLSAAAAAAAELDPDLSIEQRVVLGFPAGALVEQSQGAELLAVGARGRGRIGSALVGSVALSVAAGSACPVVVVRGAQPLPDQRLPIIVGTDGTPRSEAAIAFAFDAASARRAPLIAVHTWQGSVIADVVDWQSAAVEAEQRLAERLAGWSAKHPDVTVQRIVVRTSAARALLDQAARAQLVVVGSRGHGEIAGLLLDSVSNALVHAADCPVAIVRSRN